MLRRPIACTLVLLSSRVRELARSGGSQPAAADLHRAPQGRAPDTRGRLAHGSRSAPNRPGRYAGGGPQRSGLQHRGKGRHGGCDSEGQCWQNDRAIPRPRHRRCRNRGDRLFVWAGLCLSMSCSIPPTSCHVSAWNLSVQCRDGSRRRLRMRRRNLICVTEAERTRVYFSARHAAQSKAVERR